MVLKLLGGSQAFSSEITPDILYGAAVWILIISESLDYVVYMYDSGSPSLHFRAECGQKVIGSQNTAQCFQAKAKYCFSFRIWMSAVLFKNKILSILWWLKTLNARLRQLGCITEERYLLLDKTKNLSLIQHCLREVDYKRRLVIHYCRACSCQLLDIFPHQTLHFI